MNQDAMYRVSVKAVVYDDSGRILLAREDNGLWELLGGGLGHNEDPIECLKREISEETGLTVTDISPAPKYFVTAPNLTKTIFVANIIYETKLENLAFKPSDECQELRFFSIDEMKQVQLFPNVEKLLQLLESQRKLT